MEAAEGMPANDAIEVEKWIDEAEKEATKWCK
jgi:hypothetical protein